MVENEVKINPGKSKAVSFTKTRVEESISYCWGTVNSGGK
jgi:hypothetical protein